MNDMLNGAVAGLLATVPMTGTMELLHRQLPAHERYPLPPRQITDRMAEEAGIASPAAPRDEPALLRTALLAHFGYGAAVGALYGATASRLPGGAIGSGVLFGVVVWAGSYLGWLPATGLRRPATEQPPEREGLLLAAHVVWGAAAGWLTHALGTDSRAPHDPR